MFIIGKTECQDQEEADDIDTEAEQDELLVECAGDVLSTFGKVISPEDFEIYFHRQKSNLVFFEKIFFKFSSPNQISISSRNL